MAKPLLNEIEEALLRDLRAAPGLAYVKDTQIQGVDESNVDLGNGEIIIVAPAILVVLTGRDWRPGEGRDITGTRYAPRARFQLFVVAQNLRSREEERIGAYKMLEDVATVLAGRKLALANGAETFVWMSGADAYEGPTRAGGVAYSTEIEVRGNWDNI